MSTRPEILIIGGGYAGLIAAGRIARQVPASRVTLLDGADRFRQRIRMHERLAGGSPHELPYVSLLEGRGIRFIQGWAEGLNLRARQAAVCAPAVDRRLIEFDYLVLAIGSRTAATTPGVTEYAVRVDDEAAIETARGWVPGLAARGGRVLIVGGGLSAIETAAELATRYPGLRITMLTAGRVGADWSVRAAEHFYDFFARHRIEVLEGVQVQAVERGAVLLESGSRIEGDLTVWCAGLQAPSLARKGGIHVEPDGRVSVDATLRPPGHPSVFAAGDAAMVRLNDGETLRMSCQAALPMGAHAAANVVRLLRGEEPKPLRFGFFARCVSLGRHDGVIQFTDADDRPTGRVLTGRVAAFMKERVCRMTSTVVDWETRRGLPVYRWPMPTRDISESVAGAVLKSTS